MMCTEAEREPEERKILGLEKKQNMIDEKMAEIDGIILRHGVEGSACEEGFVLDGSGARNRYADGFSRFFREDLAACSSSDREGKKVADLAEVFERSMGRVEDLFGFKVGKFRGGF